MDPLLDPLLDFLLDLLLDAHVFFMQHVEFWLVTCTVNVYRYNPIGANAKSSVIPYTGKSISLYQKFLKSL
jgi:hypothetical protein